MPELHDPSRNYDEDLLIGRVATGGGSGGFMSRWGRWEWSKKKIIAAVLTLAILVATIVTTVVVVPGESKDVIIVTTTAAPIPTTTVPKPTTTITPTTTKTPVTTTKATPTTPTTTTTTSTTPSPSTMTTTAAPPTPPTSPPSTPPPIGPTTRKPLPPDAVNKPPISLLLEMGLQPTYTPFICNIHPTDHTFKYIVTVDNLNYTGADAGDHKQAKRGAAMAANEAIFHFTYPPNSTYRYPKPKYPCF